MTTVPTGAAPASPDSFPRQDLIVLLLSLAGGSVDAVMILGFNVLTAAQTGNTILLAVSLAQGRFATGFYSAVSVIGYMAGAAVGELVLVRRRDSASWLSPVGWAPGCRAGCPLRAARLLAPGRTQSALGTSAGAGCFRCCCHGDPKCRCVAATRRPNDHLRHRHLTTFMTETIRRLPLVESASAMAPEAQGPGSPILSPNGPVLYGVVWLVYAGGACASGLLFLRIREAALALPIIAIVAAIAAGVHITEIKIQSGGGSGPVDKGSAA